MHKASDFEADAFSSFATRPLVYALFMARLFEERNIKDFIKLYEGVISLELCEEFSKIVDGENSQKIHGPIFRIKKFA